MVLKFQEHPSAAEAVPFQSGDFLDLHVHTIALLILRSQAETHAARVIIVSLDFLP
jgi:hypothetical protein